MQMEHVLQFRSFLVIKHVPSTLKKSYMVVPIRDIKKFSWSLLTLRSTVTNRLYKRLMDSWETLSLSHITVLMSKSQSATPHGLSFLSEMKILVSHFHDWDEATKADCLSPWTRLWKDDQNCIRGAACFPSLRRLETTTDSSHADCCKLDWLYQYRKFCKTFYPSQFHAQYLSRTTKTKEWLWYGFAPGLPLWDLR